MNINLGSLFVNNNNEMMQQMQQAQGSEVKENASDYRIADIRSLLSGQLFEGDVADINNLQVKILLGDNTVLHAAMSEAVNLNIGDHVIFQVKENTGSKIVIKPYQEGNDNSLILKALNNSGIIVNDKNVSVVKELMAQGQPLDKHTIMNIVRLSNRFPDAGLKGIIELQKHDIPVTSDNLSMYRAYSDGNAGISESFKNISGEIQTVMEHILNGGSKPETMNMVSDFLNIILPDAADGNQNPSAAMDNRGMPMESPGIGPDGLAAPAAGEMETIGESVVLQKGPEMADMGTVSQDKGVLPNPSIVNGDIVNGDTVNETIVNRSYGDSESPVMNLQDGNLQTNDKGNVANVGTLEDVPHRFAADGEVRFKADTEVHLNREDNQNAVSNPAVHENTSGNHGISEKLAAQLNRAMFSDGEAAITDNGQIFHKGSNTPEDNVSLAIKRFESMARQLDDEKEYPQIKKEILDIFNAAKPEQRLLMAQSLPFKKLIHKASEKSFFIEPDDISRSENPKEDIEQLYDKVKQQLNKLSEFIKEAADKGMLNQKDASPLMNHVKTAGQNLNFMNDLNHMSSYVQIPVKFSGKEGEGELYVYNRNVKKTVEEGISAFLHFDLENLGATDIRIHLKNKGLRLAFEINDEKSVKLVEEHIDELVDRLDKKGYTVGYTVEQKEENTEDKKHNTLQEIFERDEKQVSIKRYTLDIRT